MRRLPALVETAAGELWRVRTQHSANVVSSCECAERSASGHCAALPEARRNTVPTAARLRSLEFIPSRAAAACCGRLSRFGREAWRDSLQAARHCLERAPSNNKAFSPYNTKHNAHLSSSKGWPDCSRWAVSKHAATRPVVSAVQ